MESFYLPATETSVAVCEPCADIITDGVHSTLVVFLLGLAASGLLYVGLRRASKVEAVVTFVRQSSSSSTASTRSGCRPPCSCCSATSRSPSRSGSRPSRSRASAPRVTCSSFSSGCCCRRSPSPSRVSQCSRATRFPPSLRDAVRLVTPSALRIFFLAYPIVTNVAFEAFSCYEFEHADGNATAGWLIADVSISCGSQTHLEAMRLAVLAVVLYPVGCPTAAPSPNPSPSEHSRAPLPRRVDSRTARTSTAHTRRVQRTHRPVLRRARTYTHTAALRPDTG
eukprot:1609029-Prymnesium_polylepis.4